MKGLMNLTKDYLRELEEKIYTRNLVTDEYEFKDVNEIRYKKK